jgi:hypothetical protein
MVSSESVPFAVKKYKLFYCYNYVYNYYNLLLNLLFYLIH